MDTQITSRGEIARLLKRIQQARSLLTVTLADHGKPYTSSVLDIDTQAGCLLLDELSPAEGHRSLHPGSELRVFGRIDGIELSFSTGITTIDRNADIAFYKSTLPDEVRYNQRREFHRVPPIENCQSSCATRKGSRWKASCRISR